MFLGLTALHTFIFIVVIFIFLYWLLPKNLSWISYVIIVVLFTILAFDITPNENDDLSRYFETLNYLRVGGKEALEEHFEKGWNSWDIYRVCAYYFYFISKLSDNHYLSAITVFIVYGLMFLVIDNSARRYDASKFDTFFGAMFFISTYWYYDTASGIRNGLAFAVVFVCAYYHLLLRKHIPLCILGYILACLTHSAAVMPVVLIALAVITLNNSGKFMNFLLIFGIIVGGIGIQFLSSRFPNNDFLQSIAGRAERNGLGDSLYTDTLYLTNVATVFVVALIIFYFSYYILNCDQTIEFKMFYKYCSILLFFEIGSLYSPLIFMRFARWIFPIIGAIFIICGRTTQERIISDKGEDYMYYYSPINVRARYKTKGFMFFLIFVYTVVHFWYLCAGSSLNWIQF